MADATPDILAAPARRTRSGSLGKIVRGYWFLGGLALILAMAYWTPGVGRFCETCGAMKFSIIAFSFLSGIAVSLGHLHHDLRDWRHHVWVQALTFVVTPALVYVTAFWLPAGPLKNGVYLVAALPPTLASCIAYTAAARGRVACAVINSVGGNLLGIFLSPFILALMMGASRSGGLVAAGKTVGDLVLLVLLPLIAGQLCRVHLPTLYQRLAPWQSHVAQFCVLFMSLCAFSKSMVGLVKQLADMWQCFAYLAGVHVLLVAAIRFHARRKGRTPTESAATVFCATQKTMAIGLPLAISFFGQLGIPAGLVIPPLIFYYIFQLVFGSLMIAYWTRHAPADAAAAATARAS